MTIEVATKRCSSCAEAKPLTEFYRNRTTRDGHHAACKTCHRASSSASAAKRRAAMGEEKWAEWNRTIVAVSRQRTGNKTGKEYGRAQRLAAKVLRERHRQEYDRLLLLARRGELDEEAS